MSKRLQHELTYEAPVDAVQAMLADPAFREEVCEAMGVTRVDVTISEIDGATSVRIDQWQPTEGMPGFAKKIVGDQTNIVQEEVWTGTEADVTVTIPGKPGAMTGTATLAESGGVTTETVDLTVKVNIPLVGGKVEGLISELLRKALRTENEVGRAWLSR